MSREDYLSLHVGARSPSFAVRNGISQRGNLEIDDIWANKRRKKQLGKEPHDFDRYETRGMTAKLADMAARTSGAEPLSPTTKGLRRRRSIHECRQPSVQEFERIVEDRKEGARSVKSARWMAEFWKSCRWTYFEYFHEPLMFTVAAIFGLLATTVGMAILSYMSLWIAHSRGSDRMQASIEELIAAHTAIPELAVTIDEVGATIAEPVVAGVAPKAGITSESVLTPEKLGNMMVCPGETTCPWVRDDVVSPMRSGDP